MCAVTVNAVGGAGGSSTDAANTNGSGANITATYRVVPGQSVTTVVASGGQGKPGAGAPAGAPGTGPASGIPGAPGVPGGGTGGATNVDGVPGNGRPSTPGIHAGGSGGGYTGITIGGDLVVVAGGGGGSAGGHANNGGFGGNAGLPTAVGVTPGSNGSSSFDVAGQGTPGGGQGGQVAAGGTGGVHTTYPLLNGTAGSGALGSGVGGNGGPDYNNDTGAGGGGGYTGGGGGASTYGTGSGGASTGGVGGGGGGGGSSYLKSTALDGSGAAPTGITSVAGAKTLTFPGPNTGTGVSGSASLTWVPCSYDLGVVKSASPTTATAGQTITWTVAVTNNGPSAMTRGDLVTLTDSLPAGATITNIQNSGGSNTLMANGTLTCNAAVGAALPSSLVCSRPYSATAASGAPSTGSRGLNVGETLSITYTQAATGAVGSTMSNTATVTDRVGGANNSSTAGVTIAAPVDAVNDSSLGNPLGTPVTINVIGNDTGGPLGASVTISGAPGTGKSLTVPGEGTWTVNPTTGAITFTPQAGYTGDPTPISYSVQNAQGATDTATVTVGYLATASPDSSTGNALGVTVTVPVLANDSANILPTSVTINGAPGAGKTLVVPGEGTWTVNPTTGAISFAPEAGFTGDPTIIDYTGTTANGATATSTLRVTYVPDALDDSSLSNPQGATVPVNVLANDTANVVATSVTIVGAPGAGKSLTVPGEGTWTVNPTTGVISFAPLASFTGNPTPISYRATDPGGETVQATVTVTYVPAAVNDSDLNNAPGSAVPVDVLANDTDNLVPTSVTINGAPGAGKSLVVPGQGTWTVNATTGVITFTPQSGFTGNPTPIDYSANDGLGNTVSASVTVTYLPVATNDSNLNNPQGSTVSVPVLANDSPTLVPTSVTIVGAPGSGKSLTVTGEGTWTVDPSTGAISFAPQAGFTGNPTPITYRAIDAAANPATATVTVTYLPAAANDSDLNNTPGTAVPVDVLANDSDNLVPTSVTIVGAPGSGKSLTVAGEGTWTVNATTGVTTFTPLPTFTGNPTPITYSANDGSGNTVTATVTVTYLPAATNDSDLDNTPGTTVDVPVLANDSSNLVPSSVTINGAPGTGKSLTVTGEGTWTVNPTTGAISFAPLASFTGNPTPITYTARDPATNPVSATVTITYLPVASDDSDLNNVQGSTVDVPVLANDSSNLVPSSVTINGAPGTGKSFTVTGEGTWTVNPTTGAISFAPLASFTGNPTPITYTANDGAGNSDSATVTVTYVPDAVNDSDLDNTLGTAIPVDVLANDTDNLVPTSVTIVGAPGTGKSLTVAGQGTWTVNPTTGAITFTPQAGYTGNPAPIVYSANDGLGNAVTATVTVAYLPDAVDDTDLNNPLGTAVQVPVLANDTTNIVPSSVTIVGAPGAGKTLTVAGQGVWSVDPATGDVTFTPAAGYTGDPTPITYRATDAAGNADTATVTVTYVPSAIDDEDLGNTIGDPVTLGVIGNDSANLLPSSVRIVGAPGTGKTLTVAGEGTWTVNATTGAITFTPLATFTGNPTDIAYVASTASGQTAQADVHVTYLPVAADDEDLGNLQGSTVSVPVLGNDSSNLVPSSVTIVGAPGLGTTLVVTGEGTWTVDTATGAISFAPDATFTGNPTPIDYQANDGAGNTVGATVTVTYLPAAVDDQDLGNTIGTTVIVPVLGNDSANLVPSTVRLLSGGSPLVTLAVAGEGTWTANPDGTITFVPEAGFEGQPTVQDYTASDAAGNPVTASITITYLPVAVDDEDLGHAIGDVVTVPVLDNDSGDLDASSVVILDGATPVTSLVVTGEGTWTVNPTTGAITFTPEAGFLTDPTPITYRVIDSIGQQVTATVTIGYGPEAVDDQDLDNVIGSAVTLDVLANDTGDFAPGSVRFASNGAQTLVVPGQGTWTVNADDTITFTPQAGYTGNPTPVAYRVDDVTGDTVQALVTVTYLPVATNDSSTGNKPGTAVTVNVVGNDRGDFDLTSLRLIDPATGAGVLSLTVAGQGVWTVNLNGTVTFTPQAGFTGDPTPVSYQIANSAGVLSTALITITYLRSPGLAMTGAEPVPYLLLSSVLVLFGLSAVFFGRRRRES